jgi:hypothetical protein
MFAVMPITASVRTITFGLFKIVKTMMVMVINAMMPSGMYPFYRGEEIGGRFVESILPIMKDATEVKVSVLPIFSSAIIR